MATPMAHDDGSMTFDWIFMVIVVIPMVFAAWELFKSYRGPRRDETRYRGR